MAKEGRSGFNIFNNPWKKYKTLRTVGLYFSFMALGLAASILGPTIVSMEILLDTDTKTISTAFSGGSFGYLSGAIVCGFIYAPLNKELLFSTALFGIALATSLAPFAWNLYAFVTACVLQGFFMAMIDTGGQSYILKLWQGNQYKEAVMQGAHGIWSLGSTSGPFIIQPFLADIRKYLELQSNSTSSSEDSSAPSLENGSYSLENGNYTSEPETKSYSGSIFAKALDSAYLNETDLLDLGFETSTSSSSIEDELKESVGYVRLAYVIIAGLVLICSTLYVIAFFLLKPSCCDPTHEKKKDDKEKTVYTRSYKCFRISLLVFMFFFYFTYLWVEGIPGSFLAAFVVKGLGWPNNYGALITSLYWGSHGLGRLIGVPIALCLSPRNMLIIDMVFTSVGFSLLLFVTFFEPLIWIGVPIAGLGMGTIFASAILWLENYIQLTGAASSVLLTASSLGGIIGPVLTGYLFDKYSHMCFVYVVFTASVVELIIFAGAHCYVQKYGGQTQRVKKSKKEKSEPPPEDGVELKSLKRLSEDSNNIQSHLSSDSEQEPLA